jgi:hypothetical protein
MSRLILRDAGPLGLATNPKAGDDGRRCRAWLNGLIGARVQVVVPEGADYEVRRDHDVNTMREAACTRLVAGLPMNGLLLAHQRTPVSAIIESLLLI